MPHAITSELLRTAYLPRFISTNARADPAFDAFNSLLNYLYGMLYVMVEMALVKAGIDPYMGILHADEYQKITMVYDCIEPYRPLG